MGPRKVLGTPTEGPVPRGTQAPAPSERRAAAPCHLCREPQDATQLTSWHPPSGQDLSGHLHRHPFQGLDLFPLCAQKPPARESNTPTLALENASRGPASRGQHLPFSPPSALLTSLLSPSLSFLLSLLPSFGGSFSECQAWEPGDQDQNPSPVTCKLCDLGQAT